MPAYSTSDSNIGERSDCEFAGGGGIPDRPNSIMIVGDTELYLDHVYGDWTYAGSYMGSQIGDTLMVLNNGIVDTLEGGGWQMNVHLGNVRTEIRGGQVDWFTCGAGWNDHYTVGNVSMEIFEAPKVGNQIFPIVNASVGGMYGISNNYVSGDSTLTVRGGDFSGQAGGSPEQGICAGPSNRGYLFGNATTTIDVRGNTQGLKIGSSDAVSGGLRYNGGGDTYLGTDANNTITLNVFADATTGSLLSGMNFYGDGAADGYANNTRSGKITMNINAPGADIGALYATKYPNIDSGQMRRDVGINLVSAKSVEGITSCGPNDNITQPIVGSSHNAGKHAVLTVGPQPKPANWDDRPVASGGQGLWPLEEFETVPAIDGLPPRINVTTNGITNFTSMTIKDRLLIAQKTGSILNSRGATADNHGGSYNAFGDVTVKDGAGLGVEGTGKFIAGKLTVEGLGYVVSPGDAGQVVLSDVEFINSHSRLQWLKSGSVGEKSLGTNTTSTWFGLPSGWRVITLNSTVGGNAAVGKANANKFTPVNLTGQDMVTGKTYIGDSALPSGNTGYGVCVEGSFYEWEVMPGPDGISRGEVSWRSAGTFNVGDLSTRTTPGQPLDVFGTSAMDTPSSYGSIAIPSSKVPSKVGYPLFSFIPDRARGEWIYDLDIRRSDQYAPSVLGAYNYHEFEQSRADYLNPLVSNTHTWQSAAFGRPTGTYDATNPTAHGALPSGQDDKAFSFEITVDYTNTVELEANNAVIKESDALALFGATVDAATPGTRFANLKTLTGAAGRPFFKVEGYEVVEPTIKLNRLGTPLGTLAYRQSVFTLEAGDVPPNIKSKTITVTVVPDDSVIGHDFALVARDANVRISRAQAINGQAGTDPAASASDFTKIDYFTGAVVIDALNGTVSNASLTDAATHVANISSFMTSGQSETLPYYYAGTYLDNNGVSQSFLLEKTVTLTVINGTKPFVLFDGKYDPDTNKIPLVDRDSAKTYETTPLHFPNLGAAGTFLTDAQLLAGVSGWDAEDGDITAPFTAPQNISFTLPGGLTQIPADVRRVYQVTYTVTDADNNSQTRTRAVVVGPYTVDDHYILDAKNFVTGLSQTSASGDEIVDPIPGFASAYAWYEDGTPVNGGLINGAAATVVLKSKGSYTNALGIYDNIVIGVNGLVPDGNNPGTFRPTTCARTVTGQVLDDHALGANGAQDPGGYSFTNGLKYSLYAQSFRINRHDALDLQVANSAAVWTYLNTTATPTAKDRLDLTTPFGTAGTVELVSITHPTQGDFFTLDVADITNGLALDVVLRVVEEPATTIMVHMLVNTGALPVLNVPKMKVINQGDAFLEGAQGDAAPSYRQGVSAFRAGDGDLTASVTHDSPVDVNVPGIYEVTYSITDGDYNTQEAVGYVLVNDGTYSYDATSLYVVRAFDFVQSVKNAAATWNNVEILALSKAEVFSVAGDTAIAGTPAVGSYSPAYTNTTGLYHPVITPSTAAVPTRTLTGTVIDKDVITAPANEGKADDTALYVVAANNVQRTVLEANGQSGLSTTVKDWLKDQAKPVGYKLLGNEMGQVGTSAAGIDVIYNEIPSGTIPVGDYKVRFVPTGVGSAGNYPVVCEVTFHIYGTPPVITFDPESAPGALDGGYPLVFQQTPGVPYVLSAAEIKAKMSVVDAAQGNLLGSTTYAIAGGVTIDTQNVGVYSVTYSVTNALGMSATATRAVIVTDGRYVIDPVESIILGAKDFVVLKNAVQGTQSEVRTASSVSAFTFAGVAVPSGSLVIDPWPVVGYGPGAVVGEYFFTWTVNGHSTTKTIKGTVADGTVIFPGGDNDQYAIVASDFTRNIAQAEAMENSGDLKGEEIKAANVQIFKLVASAPNARAYVVTDNTFPGNPVTNATSFDIVFGIEKSDMAATPAYTVVNTTPPSQVLVTARISQGNLPLLTVTTPLKVPLNGVFDPAQGFTLSDAEDDPLTFADATLTYNVPATGVDTNTPGLYTMTYSYTDTDGNPASAKRVVVVDDGHYTTPSVPDPFDGRLLYANSFVIKSTDVQTDATLRNDQIMDKSGTTIYNGVTGAELSRGGIVSVTQNSGYSPTPQVYPITLQGLDVPTGVLVKDIFAEVVDADVLGPAAPNTSGSTTYVYGKNIQLTRSQAEALAQGGGSAILTALGANSVKAAADGVLTHPKTIIASDINNYIARLTNAAPSDDIGTFGFTVTDEDGVTSIVLNVTVGEGNPPVLTVTPKPLNIPMPVASADLDASGNVTDAKLRQGVSAADVEDDLNNTPLVIDYTITNAAGNQIAAIPGAAPGVYQVTYTVTDSDQNSVTESRAVLVNDGRYIYDSDYVLEALSFIINKSAVTPGAATAQILGMSEAHAWKADGSSALVTLVGNGGYTNSVAAGHGYSCTIAVSGHLTLEKNIFAKVIDDGNAVNYPAHQKAGDGNSFNGKKYAIYAHNFRINVTDANALVAQVGAAAYEQSLLARAGVTSYDRTLGSFGLGGTPALVSDGGFSLTQNLPLKQGDSFAITYRVSEDQAATVSIIAFVDNALSPVIHLPATRVVWIGPAAQIPAGAVLPGSFDYLATGPVFATDDVDTQTWITSQLKYGRLTTPGDYSSFVEDAAPIDFANVTAGFYPVTYSVTDSDHNTTRVTDWICVNDGSLVIDGDYAVQAYDFVVTVDEVNAATSIGDLITEKSYAKAWVKTVNPNGSIALAEVAARIESDGGFAAVANPGYDIAIGVTPVGFANGNPLRLVKGKVTDKNVISQGPDVGNTKYAVAANNLILHRSEALDYRGLSDAAKLKIITASLAEAYTITATTAGGVGFSYVDVYSNDMT
ncbi:MAG: DUF5011 domain-containing protein, partial [Coriobacteriales bacterium]|nr:DUF5011 domain-containing protein [Coriobacteriales bacterium]